MQDYLIRPREKEEYEDIFETAASLWNTPAGRAFTQYLLDSRIALNAAWLYMPLDHELARAQGAAQVLGEIVDMIREAEQRLHEQKESQRYAENTTKVMNA